MKRRQDCIQRFTSRVPQMVRSYYDDVILPKAVSPRRARSPNGDTALTGVNGVGVRCPAKRRILWLSDKILRYRSGWNAFTKLKNVPRFGTFSFITVPSPPRSLHCNSARVHYA